MDKTAQITEHLLHFSPDALIVINERREICYVNETAVELFRYPASDLLGKALEVLIPERMHTRHADHVAAYMGNPTNREMGVRIADLTARRADGIEFPAGIRLSPFHVDDRKYVAAAVRDITESHQISQALVAAREEADRANRAKSRFLATASHDLRQPLQTIRLLNASMLKLTPDGEINALLAGQSEAIDGMARLLNGLLDISRLESGAIEPKQETVRIADLYANLRSEFEPLTRARGLTLEVELTRATLQTDRVLLRQLLENILGNAVKYTDAGSIKLRCLIKDDELLLEVADSGIGIPEDKIARIFDEYYQVDIHGERRAGVGLGLAIVREVARVLGFSIKITSQVGRGTQVQIRVPGTMLIADTANDALKDVEAPEPPKPGTLRPRLVLIEDNDGVRRAMELFLGLEGFDVVSGGAAADALRLLSNPRGDEILIVDFHLDANNTGLDVIRNVREKLQMMIPAVVASGDMPSVLRMLKEPILLCKFLGK
ncbi:MAG TPA: ATP-binding protein, partial [Steroidobacteraceae bacterium]|nr:ATP-binding protein [Steroidobacteraceae bacterium]